MESTSYGLGNHFPILLSKSIANYVDTWKDKKKILNNLQEADKSYSSFCCCARQDSICTYLFCLINFSSDEAELLSKIKNLLFISFYNNIHLNDKMDLVEQPKVVEKPKNELQTETIDIYGSRSLSSNSIEKEFANIFKEENLFLFLLSKSCVIQVNEDNNLYELADKNNEFYDFINMRPDIICKWRNMYCFFQNTSYCFYKQSLYKYIYVKFDKQKPSDNFYRQFYAFMKSQKLELYKNCESLDSFSCILFETINFFTMFPLDDIELLKSLKVILDETRLLPGVAGFLGNELVDMLENEIRCPYTSLIYKLKEEFPSIDTFIANPLETRITSQFCANLILAKKQLNSFIISLLIENFPSLKNPIKYVQEHANNLRKSLVIRIFRTFNLLNNDLLDKLSTTSANGFYNIYSKIIEIMEDSDSLSMIDCKKYFEIAFQKLVEYIPKEGRKPDEELLQGKFTFAPYPDIPLKLNDFEDKNFNSELYEIFKNAYSTRSFLTSSPPIIRLVFLGNDIMFSKFINIYYNLVKNSLADTNKAKYFLNNDIRIYIIPFRCNTLSQFLATYDNIYCRQIFLPFQRHPLNPKLSKNGFFEIFENIEQEKQLKEEASKSTFWPSVALDNQIQLYIREGIRYFKLSLHEAILHKKASCYDVPQVIIFSSRIEIGFDSIYSKGSSLIEEELPPLGYNFKTNEIKLYYRIVRVDAFHKIYEEDLNNKSSDNKGYITIHSLKIVNIPSEKDKGYEYSLQPPVLEMTYLESQNYKYYTDYINKKKGKKLNGLLSWKCAVKKNIQTVYVSNRIQKAEIAVADDKEELPLRIDGIDYKGIKVLKIRKLENMELPIMTFLPII